MNQIKRITKKDQKILRPLFDVLFPNGIRIDVSTWGFTVWDCMEGRWVIDYSSHDGGDSFEVSNEVKKLSKLKWEKPRFQIFYPKTMRKKKNKS